MHDLAFGGFDAGIDQLDCGRLSWAVQEFNLVTQIVGVVVSLAVNDEHVAIGWPMLEHGNERAVEIGSAAHTRNHDRKPRHVAILEPGGLAAIASESANIKPPSAVSSARRESRDYPICREDAGHATAKSH
jgi:hypothetical protein